MQPNAPLKVNFSEEEANSKPREVPPSGDYLVSIVDGELATVKPGKKNTGKPYWKLRFVVQDGTYAGTSLQATVMLFDGALYQLSQLLKALEFDVNSGDFNVPSLDKILSRDVVVRGFKRPPQPGDDGRDLPERFEIKVYKRPPNKADGKKAANSNLLP